jgi:error-prone DNA polymerase
VFITIEDETGVANIVMWAREMEPQRRAVMAARLMLVEGEVQRSKEGVVHLMAKRIIDRTAMLDHLTLDPRTTALPAPSDEITHPQGSRAHHPRDVRILPRSRDFH